MHTFSDIWCKDRAVLARVEKEVLWNIYCLKLKEIYGYILDLLEKNTGCPEIANYIYWSKEELTPEEIIEIALNY
jgi:hypothetical protein